MKFKTKQVIQRKMEMEVEMLIVLIVIAVMDFELFFVI